MKISIQHLIYFLLCMLLYFSCEIINPDEEIPSYVHIDKINLNIADANKEGSGSHYITDAWVYVDDNLIGAFELPATFPVLKSGKHNIKVKGGIKNNGIAATRVAYSFYEPYDTTAKLMPDSSITITPSVYYYPSTVFEWIEDFESSGLTIDTTSYSDTSIIKITIDSLIFEGKGAGYIELDSQHPKFLGTTQAHYLLPKKGVPVYLELNYKTSVRFEMGIIAYYSSGASNKEFVAGVFPVKEWTKIYIELTDFISYEVNAKDFQIYFHSELEGIATEGKIYLDNIKLVHQ